MMRALDRSVISKNTNLLNIIFTINFLFCYRYWNMHKFDEISSVQNNLFFIDSFDHWFVITYTYSCFWTFERANKPIVLKNSFQRNYTVAEDVRLWRFFLNLYLPWSFAKVDYARVSVQPIVSLSPSFSFPLYYPVTLNINSTSIASQISMVF